ncbi:unnamed protein product [Rotaria magnacalcarata]
MMHYLILVIFSTSIVQVNSQSCDGMFQYDRCSRNSACACFQLPGASNTGICTDRYAVTCSELASCNRTTNHCSQSDHTCVHHPQCRDIPVCYPAPHYNKQFCQPMPIMPNIPASATWAKNGVTVSGGNGNGNAINQLFKPDGIVIYDDQTLIVADGQNDRIIQWKKGDTIGEVVAGGNGKGNGLNQLKGPRNILIDKETDSLIICDTGRVVRWSRRSGTTQGEILIDNIA